MRTDRRTDVTKLVAAFLNIANAPPKNGYKMLFVILEERNHLEDMWLERRL
jgi:hypothetical protein